MDARKELLSVRTLYDAAYAKRDRHLSRPMKTSGIPGFLFDATVVGLLLFLAAHYFIAA